MDKSDFEDIVGIVGQYVQLTPQGASHYSGQCPFCSSGEKSLILSLDNQYWCCLSCGSDGDRYDFVAKSEKIGKAAAILLIGHHAHVGEPLPHARFTGGRSSTIKAAETPELEQAAPVAPAPSAPPETPKPETPEPKQAAAAPSPSAATPLETPTATAMPSAPQGNAEKDLLAHFLKFRNIIPSYQGAAILDGEARMVLCDSEYPSSADLAGIGEILSPILVHTGAMFSKWGMNDTVPAAVSLASENMAILVHKSGPADKVMLLVVQLANPSDVPVARRLVASVSTKLA